MLRVERARWVSFAGVALGLAGVLFIVLPDGNLPTPDAAIWVIVLLVMPLCFATNNIFVTLVQPPQATALSRAALLAGRSVGDKARRRAAHPGPGQCQAQ